MRRRTLLGLPLLGIGLGGFMPERTVPATPSSALEDIVTTWTQGLGDLTPEEAQFLTRLAADRQDAVGTRSGLFDPPGARSEIVRQPIFYDLFGAGDVRKTTLVPHVRQLVEQRGDRFYYFESGVTIDRGRWESIDALIFELRYTPEKVSTHSQTPDSKSKALLTLGTEASLALTGGLNLKAAKAEASAGVNLQSKRFDLLEQRLVSAIGEKQPWSRWLLDSGGLVRDDVRFITVLRVPKDVRSLTIDVTAIFIDKLFRTLERSRRSKHAVYRCRFDPPTCTYSA
jgi:hypothetical protein